MWIRLLSALALSGLLSACAFSDLRPPALLESGSTVERELRGRALLDRAIEVSGGRDAWEHVESAEMRLTDEWRGWVGWMFRPWPENPTRLRMHYDLEDLVRVVDGRPEIVEEAAARDEELRAYLASGIRALRADRHFVEALPGYFDDEGERAPVVHQRLERLVSLA